MNNIFNSRTANLLNEWKKTNRYNYISILNEIFHFNVDKVCYPEKGDNEIMFSSEKHNSSDVIFVMNAVYGEGNYILTSLPNTILVKI